MPTYTPPPGQYPPPAAPYGGQPSEYPQPGQYGGQPTEYSGQYGSEPGQYGSQPGQYGTQPGQYGTQPGQYGQAGEYGTPSQYGAQGTQYGAPGTQYGSASGTPGGPAKSRRGLVIGIAIGAVAVLILAIVGVVWMTTSSGSSYAVNSCVKRSGDNAVSTSCSTAGSYKIVSKVDSPTQCTDQTQPYVVLQPKGKAQQVLCLAPSK